jgi:hypothetical protein
MSHPHEASYGDSTDSSDDETDKCTPATTQISLPNISETITSAAQDVILKTEGPVQGPTPSPHGKDGIMSIRAYQLEMLAESIRQNTIVVVSRDPV